MTSHNVRTRPWAFISNMYPSDEDVSYGAFVQRSHEDLRAEGFSIDEVIAIRGRLTGRRRLKAYASHYARLALLLLRPGLRQWYVHYASHHCLLPALGARLLGKQVVVNIHGDDLALARASLYRRVMAFGQTLLLRSAQLIVVPSAFFKELVLQGLPDIDAQRIVVSPSSGIDFHALSTATAGRACYWDLPAAQRTAEIGYIGRIDADKGWETLFDAFIALPEAVRAGARLHYWGEGKDSERLRARIAAAGKGRIVHHGAIPVSELPVAHARFDFQVVASVRESLGLAALEGLGAGHVLICNAIRPFTDMTVDGVSALHVDHQSGRDLATVLADALQLPDEALRTLARNGQEIARAFDRPAVAARLAQQIDTHLVY